MPASPHPAALAVTATAYLAGLVSSKADGDLGLGMLSTLWGAPIGLVLLLIALRLVPAAQERVIAIGKSEDAAAA